MGQDPGPEPDKHRVSARESARASGTVASVIVSPVSVPGTTKVSFPWVCGRRLVLGRPIVTRSASTSLVPFSSTSATGRIGMPKRYFNNPYNAAAAYGPEECLSQTHRILHTLCHRKSEVARDTNGGIYVGPAGVAYTFWYIGTKAKYGHHFQAFNLLEKAAEWIDVHLRAVDHHGRNDTGFLIGDAGVLAVAAVIAKDSGRLEAARRFAQRFAALAQVAATHGRKDSDELLVGRAGYISGALWINKQFQQQIVPTEDLHQICDAILSSGAAFSKFVRSPSPLMYEYYGTQYLGAAHGLSSILQMLLSVPNFVPQRDPNGLVEASLRYLLSLQDRDGNFPCAMDEVPGIGHPRREEDSLIHWCHGAPGTIYLMAKAYLVFGRAEYLNAALKCGECIWRKGDGNACVTSIGLPAWS